MRVVKSRFAIVLASLVTLFATAVAPVQAADSKQYILATATTGGTFYPVGVALATLTKVKLEPKKKIGMSAISSAGSGENIKLLKENQAQFAILQALYGSWAWNGTGKLEKAGKQTHLRSVSMLWQNVEHFTVKSDRVKSGNIDDLKKFDGAKFSIGKRNSGSEGSARHILTALGINADKEFDVAYLGYGPSADALQNGSIAGMNTPAGAPVGAVSRAFANMGNDIRVLDFTDKQMKTINKGAPLWSRYKIPAGTYPGQKKDINTVAQPNFMVVRGDVPDESVYQITKTIYENLAFLNGIHKATKVMSLEKAISGLPMPLHPGAARYYKEMGVKIPKHLISK